MKSKIYGEVSVPDMAMIIKDYIESQPQYDYVVSVGCDSQNTYVTKVVTVVAIHRVGKGGIYFYDIKNEPIMKSLKQKIYHETAVSLDIAAAISQCFHDNNIEQDVEIHCDIGTNKEKGKTYALVQEIVGWVTGSGYKCEIKPNSPTASCIADRISK